MFLWVLNFLCYVTSRDLVSPECFLKTNFLSLAYSLIWLYDVQEFSHKPNTFDRHRHFAPYRPCLLPYPPTMTPPRVATVKRFCLKMFPKVLLDTFMVRISLLCSERVANLVSSKLVILPFPFVKKGRW